MPSILKLRIIEKIEKDMSETASSPLSSDYWSQTRNPLVCLIFLMPLLFVYEAGVHWLGGNHPDLLRNGADHWMRTWLQDQGIYHDALLPGLLIGGLLAWQLWGRFSWRFSPETLVGMTAESMLFAFGLLVLGQFQDLVFQHCEGLAPLSTSEPMSELWSRAVSFVGAGVYEEFLFRLCLLPVCYLALRLLLLPGKWARLGAILATSIVFAGAHYVGPAADQFSTFSFVFRALAGLFFALVFVYRGFGITVGCHAAYDVLVGVILRMQA